MNSMALAKLCIHHELNELCYPKPRQDSYCVIVNSKSSFLTEFDNLLNVGWTLPHVNDGHYRTLFFGTARVFLHLGGHKSKLWTLIFREPTMCHFLQWFIIIPAPNASWLMNNNERRRKAWKALHMYIDSEFSKLLGRFYHWDFSYVSS